MPTLTRNVTGGAFTGTLHSEVTASGGEALPLLFSYGLLYRQNYHFRSMIAKYIKEWKSQQPTPFPENGDCTAAIIRRGDRIVASQNMFEWCEKHKIHPNGSCLNDENGKIESHANCVHFYDYGCSSRIPFGEMTLEMVLHAASIVSQSKNIFIQSDDPAWLHQQVKNTTTNHLNLFLSTPPTHKNHRRSTIGGVNYMANIKIASSCSALAGHRGSAVTMFFYNIMCMRHAGHIGVCPPLYDFSQG